MENEIWLAKVYQADLKNSKVRPILIVSKITYNKKSEDVIGFWITINLEHAFSLKISNEYIKSGKLFDDSAVRCDGIIRINKNYLFKRILKTKPSLKTEVLKRFESIIK